MTALQIDTDASRQAARTWAQWADQINAARMLLGGDIESLDLPRAATACSRMTAAATELWTVSGFLTLLVEQLETLDGGAPLLHASAIDELMWLAGGSRGSVSACAPVTYSGVVGDRGDTFERELRSPYDLAATEPAELGRQLVMRALRDTATPGQIREDEFELVRLNDGRYLVALPGVIDLTQPHIGLDGENRSARDLDRAALRSSMSSSIADNTYAQMVSDALSAAHVPKGSELLIVGHSFGADTALDLAADRRFNGPSGYNVTHVVAAGYDSRPQLGAVPSGTAVLVLQNTSDVPVLVESVGHAVITQVDHGVGMVTSAARLDSVGMLTNGFGLISNSVKSGVTAVARVTSRADDIALDIAELHPVGVVEDVVLPDTSTTADGAHVVSVFDAGWKPADGGHDQARYIDFVENTSDPLVLGFLGSLAAGRAVAGTAVAVDVSIPERKRSAQET